MTDEFCSRHDWRDVADESEPPQRVVPVIGRWPGVRLMQIGGTYVCERCGEQLTIEALPGGRAVARSVEGIAIEW